MADATILEQAIELAKKEVLILKNPQSRLYPAVLERIKHLNFPMHNEIPGIQRKATARATPLEPSISRNSQNLPKPSTAISRPFRTTRRLDLNKRVAAVEMHTERRNTSLVSAPKAVLRTFIVPNLEPTLHGTRTGLIQKDRKSDLELMRDESDLRLERAIKHSQERKEAAELQAKAKVFTKYSKISSKIGSLNGSPAVASSRKTSKSINLTNSPLKLGQTPTKANLIPKTSSSSKLARKKSSLADLITEKEKENAKPGHLQRSPNTEIQASKEYTNLLVAELFSKFEARIVPLLVNNQAIDHIAHIPLLDDEEMLESMIAERFNTEDIEVLTKKIILDDLSIEKVVKTKFPTANEKEGLRVRWEQSENDMISVYAVERIIELILDSMIGTIAEEVRDVCENYITELIDSEM